MVVIVVDYNLLTTIHTEKNTQQTYFVVPNGNIKFTNSNTNLETFTDSDIASYRLYDFRDDFFDLGYTQSGSLFKLLKSNFYRQYLNNLEDNHNLKQCAKYGDLYLDQNNHSGFKPILCRDRNRCLLDALAYTNKQSSDAFDLLKSIADKWHSVNGSYPYLWDDTFTLPVDLNDKLVSMGSEGKKLFSDTVLDFYHIAFGGHPALLFNFQTWHSSNPLTKPFIHFHVIGLNIFYPLESLKYFSRKDQYFTIPSWLDIDFMRSIWYGCLKRLYSEVGLRMPNDLVGVQGEPGTKEIVWDHSYLKFSPYEKTTTNGIARSNFRIIKHKLNYDRRKPVLDIVKFFERIDKGSTILLSSSQISRLKELTSPQRHTKFSYWVGWLADGVKNKYLKDFNLYVKTKLELKKELRDKVDIYICPICGSDMHYQEHSDLIYLGNALSNSIILTESMRKGYSKLEKIIEVV